MLKSKLGYDLKKELDTRQYTQAFRIACQNANLSPYDYIQKSLEHDFHMNDQMSNGEVRETITADSRSLEDQRKFISELLNYGSIPEVYSGLRPTEQEVVDTCKHQWWNKKLTYDAAKFFESVRDHIRNRAMNLGLVGPETFIE